MDDFSRENIQNTQIIEKKNVHFDKVCELRLTIT